MCELLAIAWPEPERFERILPWALQLEHLGVARFGWGVAWSTQDGLVRAHRSAGSLADDPAKKELALAESSRFLVHLRRPSRLSTTQLADTQPFVEEGGAFSFCHNGQLDRHGDLRAHFAGRLAGQADSEVGFRLLEELSSAGESPRDALVETHRRLEGRANFGYLGADGTLLVYGGNPWNAIWRFEYEGADVAATALHSDDTSLFDLLFHGVKGEKLPDGAVSQVGGGESPVARPARSA